MSNEGPKESNRLHMLMAEMNQEFNKTALSPEDQATPVTNDMSQLVEGRTPQFETERAKLPIPHPTIDKPPKQDQLRVLTLIQLGFLVTTIVGLSMFVSRLMKSEISVSVCRDDETTIGLDCAEMMAGVYVGVLNEHGLFDQLDQFARTNEDGVATIPISSGDLSGPYSVGIFNQENDIPGREYTVVSDGEKDFMLIFEAEK